MIEDKFFKFIMEMQDSTDYLKIPELKNQYCYKIYARNAYVGVWSKSKQAFLISRYKAGPHPYLFYEYHWDTGEPLGTVKPLELIEKCPFEIRENYDRSSHDEELLVYLDNLEENHPIIESINSLQDRKLAAISFAQRLSGKRSSNSKA